MEPMELKDIKRSLELIKVRTNPLKDGLLELLLGMTILHLSRKLNNSAIEISRSLPALHIFKRNDSKTLALPARRLRKQSVE